MIPVVVYNKYHKYCSWSLKYNAVVDNLSKQSINILKINNRCKTENGYEKQIQKMRFHNIILKHQIREVEI